MAGGQNDGEAPLAEINVTPFVDVMLVLLIIFMVTAPMLDQGLSLNLPQTKGSSLETSTQTQMILKVTKDRTVQLNDRTIRLTELKETVKKIFGTGAEKTLFVRADKDVPYGFVAYVMGEVRAAGVSKLALVTLPLEDTRAPHETP